MDKFSQPVRDGVFRLKAPKNASISGKSPRISEIHGDLRKSAAIFGNSVNVWNQVWNHSGHAMAVQVTEDHEAGHAVAAIYLDQAFSEVSIVGNEKAAGYVVYEDSDPEILEAWNDGNCDDARVVQWVERSLIVTFADAIAQRRFSPRSDWRQGVGHGKFAVPGSDIQTVIRRIDGLGYRGKDAATYQSDLQARAALVNEHWPEIQKVAEALVEH